MDVQRLLQRIERKEARVGVIGLGYVGLPLGHAFAQAGFRVLGFDIDPRKVQEIEAGRSYIDAVPTEAVARLRGEDRLRATTDFSRVRELDAVAICVPTPLTENQDPDTSYIEATADQLGPHLPEGILVVLESTTYPGTTRDLLGPRLERASGGKKQAGRDFLLAFSPERENPGSTWRTDRIPKVVGADDPASREAAIALYRQAVVEVVPVSSSAVAEAAKLLENIYRCVNIALVNELKVCFDRMGIDVFEVIEAAKTKPFGFQAFYPGPGLGGHCLAGGETVWVRDRTGVRALPVEELFPREGAEVRPDGVEVVRPAGLEALSFDPLTREPVFAPVTHLFRRHSPEPLLRIRTAGNQLLTVTPGHPMLRWDGYRLVEARADAMEAGDSLPLLTAWPDEPDESWDDRIDLIDMVVAHGLEGVRVAPRSGSWREHENAIRPTLRALGIATKDVLRHDTMPLAAWLELERARLSPFTRDQVWLATGKGRSHTTVPAVLRANESFARLVGYYLSEGCITADGTALRTRFSFGAHEAELIQDVERILADVGLRSSRHRLRTCETVHIKVSSRLFALLLRDVLRCGVRSEDAAIPARLLGAPARIRSALLAGLLRGDGDVDATSGYRSYRKGERSYHHHWNSAKVGYFTSSPVLFQQVVGLVQSLGLVPTLHRSRPHLSVAGPQVDALEPLLAGAKAGKLERCRQARRRSTGPRTYEQHETFATVRVTEIERVSPESVYSLEVAGTHTFVTSYGLIVHNCIPLDPVYLSWKAKEFGVRTRFVDLAGEVNTDMPRWVLGKCMDALNEQGKCLRGAKVLLLGMAYKKDIDDVRESPALTLWDLLQHKGAQVAYHDPHVPHVGSGRHYRVEQDSVPLTPERLRASDLVLIVTDHTAVDYAAVVQHAPLVVDSRDATRKVRGAAKNVVLA